jgi:hypothetical protein
MKIHFMSLHPSNFSIFLQLLCPIQSQHMMFENEKRSAGKIESLEIHDSDIVIYHHKKSGIRVTL